MERVQDQSSRRSLKDFSLDGRESRWLSDHSHPNGKDFVQEAKLTEETSTAYLFKEQFS